MAKFQKGQSGNPKGRPKGSTNDKTKYIKDWAISLIGSNAKKLSDEFKLLPLKERWKVVSQLMPYVLPKQPTAYLKSKLREIGKMLTQLRRNATFFGRYSSLVNIEVLGEAWFPP